MALDYRNLDEDDLINLGIQSISTIGEIGFTTTVHFKYFGGVNESFQAKNNKEVEIKINQKLNEIQRKLIMGQRKEKLDKINDS